MPILFIIFIILLIVFSPKTFGWITSSFKPVIYALIMAYLLDSAVNFFVRILKVRRSQGILLACIILIGFLSFMVYKVVPQVVDNINNIVSYIMNGNVDIVEIINNLKGKIDSRYIDFLTDYILQASESVKNTINRLLIDMSNILMRFLRNIGTSTFTVITSFIINIYMLVEKEDILARGRRVIYAYFNEKNSKKILTVFSQSNKIFKAFLNGKLLDSAIVGVICAIAFYLFKVPYAPLMGTIIGFFNIIPFFGPIIGSVPVIIVSFFLEPAKAITALIIILVIQQLDANILDPKIVGGNVGVSPFWIITSVTVAGNLFGIPGMVLGVPAVVLIKTVIEESVNLRLIEKGISDIEKENMKT
ncbi:AI-2E family transporter [Sedimentibacter sp.]|uniref:AI-2E family transporter n=1 Tax=Sedimentibacter sp. TaxID=1960295 RepID=UPI00289D0814|nr:AI-2E family transporter [Sedimentibacter sp.]